MDIPKRDIRVDFECPLCKCTRYGHSDVYKCFECEKDICYMCVTSCGCIMRKCPMRVCGTQYDTCYYVTTAKYRRKCPCGNTAACQFCTEHILCCSPTCERSKRLKRKKMGLEDQKIEAMVVLKISP